MPCRTCYYWLPDEQREKSMRGYCRNSRADKSANRTVFDYSCREHTAQQNAHLTPESLASSQAVSYASALEQSDGDTPPAQAQVA